MINMWREKNTRGYIINYQHAWKYVGLVYSLARRKVVYEYIA